MLSRLLVWGFLAVSVVFAVRPISAAALFAVDTPSSCYITERVEGANVYLRRMNESCGSGAGKAFLSDEFGRVPPAVSIYLDGAFWRKQKPYPVKATNESVTNALRQAEGRVKPLEGKLQPNLVGNLAERVDRMREYLDSPEYRAQIAQETERVRKDVFGSATDSYYQEVASGPQRKDLLAKGEAIYIFVSSSMPVETVRRYVSDASALNEANVRVVMRGFVSGVSKIMPTFNWIRSTLVMDAGCDSFDCDVFRVGVGIDPVAFRRFDVNHVPAVVFVRGLNSLEDVQDDARSVSDYYKISGDSSLRYHLERIADAGGGDQIRSLAKRLP